MVLELTPPMLAIAVVTVSIVIYYVVRPLKVLTRKEWLFAHGFLIAGLTLLSSWLWLYKGDKIGVDMLIGIWNPDRDSSRKRNSSLGKHLKSKLLFVC